MADPNTEGRPADGADPAGTDVAEGPCPRVRATAADGAVLEGCAHGGQVLGWIPAGGAVDRLWVSPLARCGPGLALRGGVPVIFPRFSDRELPGGPRVPRHGLARDRAWRLSAGRTPDGEAVLEARLTADAATDALWPFRFTLTLRTTASGDRLRMTAGVRNDGEVPLTFVLALHTYLAVSDAATTVHGLAGRAAQDNAGGGALTLPDDPLPTLGPRDLTVPGALAGPEALTGPGAAAVALVDPRLGRLELTADGLDDLVVWNPGAGHGPADVPAGGASSFVCLEAARLAPANLDPGATWSGTQQLTAR